MPPPGDLPNQGIKPGLLRCRQILHCWSHQGSDEINTVKIFAMISSVLSGGIEPHLSLEGDGQQRFSLSGSSQPRMNSDIILLWEQFSGKEEGNINK